MNWNLLSEAITHGLLIATSLIILIHLVAILIFKEVKIKEPRVPILVFEILIMVAIMGLGMYNYIMLMKSY